MWKRWVAVILAFAMALAPVSSAYGMEANVQTAKEGGPETELANGGLEIGGENTFGEMVADEFSGKMQEQEGNNGCNIYSAQVEGKNVTVEFESTEACSLAAAAYDEEGVQMQAMGSLENIMPGVTQAVLTLETEEMPQYFYLRVFLIAVDGKKPLCEAYESPMYTRKMQEFLAKTTSDFDQEQVLNLDEDETNNFAVYNEGTLRIREGGAGNKVAFVDEEEKKYVIENATESVLALQTGDVLSYEYENGEVLIVKVAGIEAEGTTVTLTGADTQMEEVFTYVKLDAGAQTQDAAVDESSCAEGVVYEGMLENVESAKAAGGSRPWWETDISGAKGMSLKFSFMDVKLAGGEENNVKLKGSVNVKFENKFRLYLASDQKYLELKQDYEVAGSVGVDGKVKGSVPLATVAFIPVPGVIIQYTPSFLAEFSASMTVSVKAAGTVGFSVSEKGLKNLTSSPKLDASLKLEGSVFIGLSLEPEIKILSKMIAEVSMEAQIGGEVKASCEKTASEDIFGVTGDVLHSCQTCFDGDISGKMSLSFSASLLNWEKLTFEFQCLEATVKVADFYYSADKNELGWGSCPYQLYKVTATVKDAKENPVADAELDSGFEKSDVKGKSVKYLPAGEYILYAKKQGKGSATKSFKVEDAAKSVTLQLKKGVSGGAISMGENSRLIFNGNYASEYFCPEDDDVEAGLLDANGNFYMHYRSKDMTQGPGFHKVLEDVREANLNGIEVNAGAIYKAITNDGTLYVWGGSSIADIRDLGNGMHFSRVPVPVLFNVKKVQSQELLECIMALTEEGKLYAWRTHGGPEEYAKPFLVAEEVEQFVLDERKVTPYQEALGAILFKNGDLYTFGQGKFGDGTEGYCDTQSEGGFYKLHKVMENVAQVNLLDKEILTKDGGLYVWGGDYGLEPVKILDHVAKIYDDDGGAAILENGDLYFWGERINEGMKDPSVSDYKTPHKVFENVVDFKWDGEDTTGWGQFAAWTSDGGFYTWGHDHHERPLDNLSEPIWAMDHVKDVVFGALGNILALKENGELYRMECYVSSSDASPTPQKVLGGVAAIERYVTFVIAYMENGQMYMWGTHYTGERELADKYKFDRTPTLIKLEAEEDEEELAAFQAGRAAGSAGDADSRTDSRYGAQQETVDASAEGTSLTGLLPDTLYYFYSMRDRYADAPFSPDNLLYITQCTSNGDGTLTVPYHPKEEDGEPQMFAACMGKKDITEASVAVNDLTYTGAQQQAQVSVSFQGGLLTEGEDYELEGAYAVTEEGNYSLRVRGIGEYCGTQTVSYQVRKQPGSEGGGGNQNGSQNGGGSQNGSQNGGGSQNSSGTGVKPGQAQGGKKESPKTGTVFTSGKLTYVVTGKTTAAVKKAKNKSQKSLKIPATVKYKGRAYKVTEIKDSAFASNKKLASVTIGKNVKKIGKKVFYKCVKLKKVTISTAVLKSVGKNAFKGIAKKASVKVPKKKKTSYKKLLKKGGLAKTAKVK